MGGLPPHLISGLADSEEIGRDIERFIAALRPVESAAAAASKSDL